MRTIVIGDLHGDYAGLAEILRATGATDAGNYRLSDTTVIQLGDLIHGGNPRGVPRPGVDDTRCAELALAVCDTILIGNHELPHLWPDAGFPVFGGQRPIDAGLRDRLLAAYERGQLVPAYAHEDWLLTHAGLHPSWQVDGNGAPSTLIAPQWMGGLCSALRVRIEGQRRYDQLFDSVGRSRGGRHHFGGIFWCDWDELTEGEPGPIPQIVGHTPQDGGYARHGDSWCVDSGAALSGTVSAIVQDEAGGEWRPVVVAARTSERAA